MVRPRRRVESKKFTTDVLILTVVGIGTFEPCELETFEPEISLEAVVEPETFEPEISLEAVDPCEPGTFEPEISLEVVKPCAASPLGPVGPIGPGGPIKE